MNEKNSVYSWVKEHKKHIMVGLGITAVVITGVLIGENWDALHEVTVEIHKAQSNNNLSLKKMKVTEVVPVQYQVIDEVRTSTVNSFVRNLPDGQHASHQKIATAAEHGFELIDNQTWVESFSRTIAA